MKAHSFRSAARLRLPVVGEGVAVDSYRALTDLRYYRSMNDTRLLLAALAAVCLLASPARADWGSCLSSLRHSAAASGVSEQTISSALGNLEPNDAVSFMDKQPEFSTPVWDYIAALVDEERVDEGRALLHQHGGSLQAAQARFGVDPAIIVAVWGVEFEFRQEFWQAPGGAIAGDAGLRGPAPQ